MPPEAIAKYMQKDYKDVIENTAYHTLTYLSEQLNIDHEFIKGWKDALIAATEIYYVGVQNSEPYMERVNPEEFDFDKAPGLEFIEDGLNEDFYTKIGKKIFQEMHVFFQIVNIETETDFLGFNDYNSFKSEKFLKFESESILSNFVERNIYETGDSFCDVTLKLSNKVLTQRRTYTKLLEILGNIGGLMQVLFSFLRIISSFPTQILYEEALVNNLFQFNLDTKEISLVNKEKKYIKKNNFSYNQIPKLYIPPKEHPWRR